MKVLVIGGTLFIGRVLVAELLKADHQVTVLHRKPEHGFGRKVGNLQADRNDAASLKAALAGKSFDAVFDNVYDWERGTTAAQVEATAKALGGGIQRYVFTSSVAAYGGGLNHYEGDGLVPDNYPDAYARNKAMSERALFRMHQRHGTPVVTLRLPFLYGPGNPFYREQFFWDRIRDSRTIIVPGDGRRLMQFLYAKDFGPAAVRAMTEPAAVGHAFNLVNPKSVTQIELVEALATAAKKPVKMRRMPRETLTLRGGSPMGPNLYFGMYFDLPPITMLVTKAQRVLKFKPTPPATGLKATHQWWKTHAQNREPDYCWEDTVLTAAAK